MSTRTILAAAMLCLAPARPPADEPAVLLPLVTLSGAHSHVTEKRCLRVTTQDEWASLWLEHLGEEPRAKYDIYYNKAALPVVDFERCMVIAIFCGRHFNVAGVSARLAPEPPAAVDEATAAGPASADEVALYLSWHSFQTTAPGPDGGALAVSPFGFFIVPRTSAPLVVRDVNPTMGGGPVSVRQRERLPRLQAGGR